MTLRTLAPAGLAMLLLGAPAQAVVLKGTSEGYGLLTDVTVDATPTSSGKLPAAVSGVAPPPYAVSDSVAGEDGTNTAGLVTTGQMDASAESDVDGLPGLRGAAADAVVGDLSISLLIVLSVSATEITSAAEVIGDHGAYLADGDANFTGLSISVLGIPLPGLGDISPAPNTTIPTAILGLEIILNEQIVTGDGTTQRKIEVNALRLNFDDVLFGPLLGQSTISGSMIFGHSEAQLIPEPATALLLAGGLLGLASASRRRS